MQYDAFVSKEGGSYLVEFPDCPGCQTFAESVDDVLPMAREALEGWLEASLVDRRIPPRPERRRAPPMGCSMLRVPVNPVLSLALQVRWIRSQRGLSQGDLAAMVGVSQQAVAKLEDPDGNPTLETIRKVAEALDLRVELSLDDLLPFAENMTVRASAEHGLRRKVPIPEPPRMRKARVNAGRSHKRNAK